ncbi:uncharacterized protein LOC128196154 [Vigna angularis]|uniref:uncharacterized protein LOC128196154 n=1 Tax=Phaseolus angularis TaxID=3914 RepID=UPI0022B39BB3|nr:uncharacterized protein LOC128196154 [Vigna angularis]
MPADGVEDDAGTETEEEVEDNAGTETEEGVEDDKQRWETTLNRLHRLVLKLNDNWSKQKISQLTIQRLYYSTEKLGRIAQIFNTYLCLDDGRVVSNFVAQAIRKHSLTTNQSKSTKEHRHQRWVDIGISIVEPSDSERRDATDKTGRSEQYISMERTNQGRWLSKDQMVRMWLLTSLSDFMRSFVVGWDHSWEIWSGVHEICRTELVSKIKIALWNEMKNTKKGNRNVIDYLSSIGYFVDMLVEMGDDVTEREHIDAILEGLPEEGYESVRTIIRSRVDATSSDLETLMIIQEMVVSGAQPPIDDLHRTNDNVDAAGRGGGGGERGGRGGDERGGRGRRRSGRLGRQGSGGRSGSG